MGKDDAAKAHRNGGGNDPADPGSGWRSRAVTIAGRRMRIVVVAAIVGAVVLIGLVVGAYAYDHAHKDQISDGAKVADVDVGRLNRNHAADRIQRRPQAPISS